VLVPFLSLAAARGEKLRTRRPFDPRIERALQLLEQRLPEATSLLVLSKAACMSPFAFLRAFKRALGQPPCRYITERRIGMAKQLLLTTAAPVNDIGFQVGWSNPSYFSHVFRRLCSMTPREYRQRHYWEQANSSIGAEGLA
jgi:AraC family transcriptional regulator